MSDNGGPAFPASVGQTLPDMSLRDYFAAQCLCVLANGDWRPGSDQEMHHLVGRIYQIADAMIAERAKAVP